MFEARCVEFGRSIAGVCILKCRAIAGTSCQRAAMDAFRSFPRLHGGRERVGRHDGVDIDCRVCYAFNHNFGCVRRC